MTNNDQTITWLHLSDFHFKADKNWQQDVVMNTLERDVIKNLPEKDLIPDLVFLTGDIAHSGKSEEYQRATEYFQSLAKDLGHPGFENWFVVPGNHDVDRSLVNPMFKTMRDTVTEQNINDILGQSDSWRSFSTRLQGFFDFTIDFLGKDRAWEEASPWSVEFRMVKGLKVAVLCLNSAWACQDEHDEGKLLISEFQIRQVLSLLEKEKPDFKVALVHHPFDHLKKFDAKQVKQILCHQNHCQALLRGHLHETAIEGGVDPDGMLLELAVGACWQDAKHPHSALAVQLNRSTKKCTVFAWTYETNRGGFWVPDNRLYPNMVNGQWEFEFPKAWEKRFTARRTTQENTITGPLVPTAYRDYLTQEYGVLETLVENESPFVFRLQKVYVPLQTDWTDPKKKTKKEKQESPDPLHLLRKEKIESRRSLADVLTMDMHKQFVLVGDPGSGKSTFLRYQALEKMSRKDPCLPIMISLKDVRNSPTEGPKPSGDILLEWASKALSPYGLTADHLRKHSGKGKILWFLDGLDEIVDRGERLRCARAIGEWFRTCGKNERLVLTTRPHAVQQAGILKALGIGQTVARVLPLDEEGQQEFLKRWFEAVYGQAGSEKVAQTSKALRQALEKNTRLAKLKENPLLLSVIATIYHQGKQLPERRADLYRKAVDILLERRFGAVAGGDPALVRKMCQGLMTVARQMHESRQIREIKDGDFMNYLQKGFYGEREILEGEKLELKEHMEKLGCHSGLLTMLGTRPSIDSIIWAFRSI